MNAKIIRISIILILLVAIIINTGIIFKTYTQEYKEQPKESFTSTTEGQAKVSISILPRNETNTSMVSYDEP